MILTGTMIAAVATFLVNEIIVKSEGFETAKDEVSTGFWEWIRPIFIKENKETAVRKIEQDPEKNKPIIELTIEEIASKDEEFDKKLAGMLEETAKKAKINVEDLEAYSIKIRNEMKGNTSASFKNLKAKGNIDIDNKME
jgi:hypothetical protein